jgi:hypothetical protein
VGGVAVRPGRRTRVPVIDTSELDIDRATDALVAYVR